MESLVNNSSTGFAHWGGREKEVPGTEDRLRVEEGEGQELRNQDFLGGTGGGGGGGVGLLTKTRVTQAAMDWMFVSSSHPHVYALTPNVMVFEGGAFGR